MIVRRARSAWGVGLGAASLVVALAGCAPMPPPFSGNAPPTTPASPAPSTTVPSPSTTRREPAPSSAVLDSTPSRDAERVLATIPEPLTAAQQVAAPVRDTAVVRRAVPAPEAAYDTLRAERPSDDGAAVPVPAPTPTLRTPQPVTFAPPESTAVKPAANPPAAASPAPATPAAPTTVVHTGDCWRLQVAAPAERPKAESRLSAAQSLLLVPMVIEHEKGLFKVRTRDCLTREAADALKKRATASGFAGSFVLKSPPVR